MIPKTFDVIEIKDIQALKDNGRSEDRTIEYKSQLPTNAESQKIPFLLKPVCSFANTDGGDLILGIEEENGIPKNICGINLDDPDSDKLRLEHFIQTGIEPQVRGIKISILSRSDNNCVVLVCTPKSWTAFHRVKSNSRFYARNSAGVYELDVPQIRQAFIYSDSISQRMRDFRADRIAALISDNTPVRLREGARISLHIVPLASIATNKVLDVTEYQGLFSILSPPGTTYISHRLNFDGIVIFSGAPENGFVAYNQFYRSGIIEFVRICEVRDGLKLVPSYDYEHKVLKNYVSGIHVLRDLGFQPPFFIFLTLVAVKGYTFYISDQTRWHYDVDDNYIFDRDILPIQEIEVNSFEQRPEDIMRPLFDIVWNSVGLIGSLNFNANNEWIRK